MMDDGETNLVQCPFVPSHRIRLGVKFQKHLIACRKNCLKDPNSPYYKAAKTYQQCPFNTSHWLPPEKVKAHLERCDSRIIAEHAVYQPAEEPGFAAYSERKLAEARMRNQLENPEHFELVTNEWEEETNNDPNPGPGYDPMIKIRNNPNIVYNKQGLSRSEKIAFRKERRLRAEGNWPQGDEEDNQDFETWQPAAPPPAVPKSKAKPKKQIDDDGRESSKVADEDDGWETVGKAKPQKADEDFVPMRQPKGFGRGIRKPGPPPGFEGRGQPRPEPQLNDWGEPIGRGLGRGRGRAEPRLNDWGEPIGRGLGRGRGGW